MKNTKIITIIAGFFVLFIVLDISFVQSEVDQRRILEDIEISFSRVQIHDIGFEGTKLDIMLKMYNPNDITATLDKVDYDLWFNNNLLGSGTTNEKLDIPPFESKNAKTNFDLSFSGASTSIISAITEDKTVWRLSGIAYYDTIFGTLEIPFDISK